MNWEKAIKVEGIVSWTGHPFAWEGAQKPEKGRSAILALNKQGAASTLLSQM
jgi:hypothetical protein